MKVIAKTATGLLLEATLREVAHLMGEPHLRHHELPDIGSDIAVSDVFAYGQRHDALRRKAERIAGELEDTAALLREKVEPFTRAITENDGEAAADLTNP